MDLRDKIIDFLKISGPTIPVKVAKQFNTNILMASAFLSELSARGKVKVSNLKIGGTPLYYLEGQESKLQYFAVNLNAKEKAVYDELSNKKVLQDKTLEPIARVVLREIKDYAKPFTINNEIYWRWYLLSEEEAVNLVKSQTVSQIQEEPKKIQPVQEMPKPIIIEEKIQVREIHPKKIEEKLIDGEKLLLEFFKKNEITYSEISGKKTDMECEIHIPSSIGRITCYCKAKFKKRITDADISSAYMQSQYKKLPLVFLYTGELAKKADEMLRDFPSIIIKNLSNQIIN